MPGVCSRTPPRPATWPQPNFGRSSRLRLGVEWGPVHNGIADLAGIDRGAILAVSSRRKAVLSLAEEMGYDSPAARQTAALATRPGKDRSVDAAELHERWTTILDGAGFDQQAVAALKGSAASGLGPAATPAGCSRDLASPEGVTEQAAVFDRRNVIQAIAPFGGDRLTAARDRRPRRPLAGHRRSGAAADRPAPRRDHRPRRRTRCRSHRTSSATPHPRCSRSNSARSTCTAAATLSGFGVVDPHLVEAAISGATVELGADQAAMVRAVCTSGDQFQAVVGRAGAGKTTALRAAADAWQRAGYTGARGGPVR